MPSDDCERYRDFLSVIGEFGAFQKWLLIFMIPSAILFSFTYFGQIFMILVPRDFWCRIPELESRSKEEQLELAIPKLKNGDFDRCSMYERETGWADENQTRSKDSWASVSCPDGWTYDKEQLRYPTIATENNWVCEDLVLGTFTMTAFFVGSIIGCLVFGYVADHFGRVWAFLLANTCSLVGGCCTVLCQGFYSFTAARFIVGLAMNNCFIPIYILTMENVGLRHRTLVGNLSLALGFTLGGSLLPWVAHFCHNWRYFALAVSLPVSALIVLSIFLPESPNWLLSVGKIDRGVRVLRRAAKANGKTVPEDVWADLGRCYTIWYNDLRSEKTYNCLDLFRRFRRCCVMLVLIGLWMILALVYDVHVRAVFLMGTDTFLTFSLSTLTELPAGLVPMLLVDRIGRKPVAMAVMILSAVCSFLAIVLKHKWYVAIAAIFGRLFISTGFNVLQQWATEILPTVVRGQGMAIVNIVGCMGALLGPYIIYTERFVHSFPMITNTLMSIIAASLIVLLPETRNMVMPHTLEEAELRWTLCCGRQIIPEK
ncbi:hypothetical protein KR018_010478 [Drosophila ironensis]|nr:hypothetical protein KR018_010478 [Drosophila ironensis]